MSQLRDLSDQLERARSQYDASTAQLAKIQRDLMENRRELKIARRNLKSGQHAIARRLVTLYQSDQTSTLEARTDIAAVKFTMARVLREVSYNALHILGSLGTTDLTPIQAMYASAPTMGIADGVDEVHVATVARRVLRGYRPHEGNWPTEYIPAKREQAWQRMRPVLDARPDLARAAEKYAARQ